MLRSSFLLILLPERMKLNVSVFNEDALVWSLLMIFESEKASLMKFRAYSFSVLSFMQTVLHILCCFSDNVRNNEARLV